MKYKITWLIVSCLMVSALVLASCAPAAVEEEGKTVVGKVVEKEAPVEKEEEEEKEVAPAVEGPQYGGHLRFAYTLEASSLDPILGRSGGDGWYWRQMYDQLVSADRDLVSRPELSLAESWEFPDATTMVFHLRRGVRFHDNTEFNAEAVKFNIERLLDPATAATPRASFTVIDSVEVVDKYTVKFNLKRPWGAGLAMIAERGGCMNSPTAVQKLGKDYGFKVVATGPFKLLDYVSGASCTMERNQDYWGEDSSGNRLPYLDKLSILIIPDMTVATAALESGKIDVVGILWKDIEKFEKTPDISLTSLEGSGIGGMAHFNRALPPMDNVYLRKAFCYGINPEPVVEAVYFGKVMVAKGGVFPPGCWVYDDTVPRPYYDPEKAREFLKLGGYPDGFKVDVCTYGGPAQELEMYQAQLAEIGIDVEIHVFEVGTMVQKMWITEEFPAMLTGWSRYPEPDWIASGCFKSDGFYNAGNVPNPEMDELVERGASTYDIAERKAIYRQINEIVLDECWFVPFTYGTVYMAYWNKVQGMDTAAGWDAKYRFRQVWIRQ